jgi:hypothetical protein
MSLLAEIFDDIYSSVIGACPSCLVEQTLPECAFLLLTLITESFVISVILFLLTRAVFSGIERVIPVTLINSLL